MRAAERDQRQDHVPFCSGRGSLFGDGSTQREAHGSGEAPAVWAEGGVGVLGGGAGISTSRLALPRCYHSSVYWTRGPCTPLPMYQALTCWAFLNFYHFYPNNSSVTLLCDEGRFGEKPEGHQGYSKSRFLWANKMTFGLLVTLSQLSGRVFYQSPGISS